MHSRLRGKVMGSEGLLVSVFGISVFGFSVFGFRVSVSDFGFSVSGFGFISQSHRQSLRPEHAFAARREGDGIAEAEEGHRLYELVGVCGAEKESERASE